MAREQTTGPINEGIQPGPFVLKSLILSREWTIHEYCSETGMQMRTAKKVFGGDRVNVSTARSVAQSFGVDLLTIVDPSDYTPPKPTSDRSPELGTGKCAPGKPLSEVITTGNGLQYRVYEMGLGFDPVRRGRGQRYEFDDLADDAKEETRHRLSLHLSVCELVAGHRQFPTCYTTLPDENREAGWVIDEWIDGQQLADLLDNGTVEFPDLQRLASELAMEIKIAHDVKRHRPRVVTSWHPVSRGRRLGRFDGF